MKAVVCFQCTLVAHLNMGAASCPQVVVACCWLCCFGLQLAIKLPWGLLVAYLALLGQLESHWGITMTLGIKSSHLLSRSLVILSTFADSVRLLRLLL